MRNATMTTLFVLFVLGVGGFLYLAEPFNPERRMLRELSTSFMEDIQFKDFRSSALYHHELEQDRVDIGKAIEKLFLMKPEMLDILDYRLTRTEIDSTGRRGRVLVNVRFRRLNMDDDPKESDLQLFWIRRHPQCPLGADCNSGVCTNERGVVYQEVEPRPRGAAAEEEKPPAPYQCDESQEHAWFMNLDSTLESRDYR